MPRKEAPAPDRRQPAAASRLAGLVFRGPVLALAIILGAFGGGAWLLWSYVRPVVLSGGAYTLGGPESLEITPLPDWIHTDVRGEVYRDLAAEGSLSIADQRLAERVSAAFALHPWVAKVRRVEKRHPARVVVHLDYRRPVSMVEVAGGLLPVDREGRWLPSSDFSPVEASRYPRLSGVPAGPIGAVGMPWGDPRVTGGAEIAAVLLPVWAELGLARLAPSPTEPDGFELFTQGGVRVVWGRTEASSVTGEPTPSEKLARLKQHAGEEGLDREGGPRQIDLRRPPR